MKLRMFTSQFSRTTLEEEINDWLEDNDVTIIAMSQSESCDNDDYETITISILYRGN
jgi:hypothetical protein